MGETSGQVEPKNLAPPCGPGWWQVQLEGLEQLQGEVRASMQVGPNQLSWKSGWGGAWCVLPPPTFPPPVLPASVPLRMTHKGPHQPSTALPGPDTFVKPTKWRPATTGPRILGRQEASACIPGAGTLSGHGRRAEAQVALGIGEG